MSSQSSPAIDTSRHTSECLCEHCERNGTGQFAQRAAADWAPPVYSERSIEVSGYYVNLSVSEGSYWRILFHGVTAGLCGLVGRSESPEAAESDALRNLRAILDGEPLAPPAVHRGPE